MKTLKPVCLSMYFIIDQLCILRKVGHLPVLVQPTKY